MSSNIPPELVSNILSRLAVKPLLQFRCVSKQWRALIDNPHFISSHLHHSIQSKSNRYLLAISQRIHSMNLNSLQQAVENNQPIELNKFTIVGSCNGLLCLSAIKKDSIVLWNPSTHKSRVLPPTDITDLGITEHVHFVYGFGYDHLNHDYKVVRIVQFRSRGYQVKVYSLKSNTWKRIPYFPYDLPEEPCNGVFAAGALHWIVKDKTGSGSILIGALDLATEEYGLVPLPFHFNNDFDMRFKLLEGCLCLLCKYESVPTIDLWVMKERWTKFISNARAGEFGPFEEAVKPGLISKRGDRVIWEFNNEVVVWNDVERGPIEQFLRGFPKCFSKNVYVGSLVQLNSDNNGSDLQKQQAQEKGNNDKNVSNKRDDFLSKGFKLVL